MLEAKNEQLGNFGFLLDFNQDFLFEFAQLAESNLYVNKRLCAVYIRQLTESFFDTVIDREGIEIERKSLTDGMDNMASISDKQKAIDRYYNDRNVRRPAYGKRAFPRYPGSSRTAYSRLECPEGEGDNRVAGSLVDPEKKTLYVWDFIRRLGNAGSHAVLSVDNKRWLEEKYMIAALEQLCFRMGTYFYGVHNEDNKAVYRLERCSLASRMVFYPKEDGRMISVQSQGILPGYVEKKYYTVMPKSYTREGKLYWENYINKYFIIRRYEIRGENSVRDYLLQSQKAYLILQQTGNLEGIASYAVLADLRNSANYYVTSYEFDTEPLELSAETLRTCGVYDSPARLMGLCLRLIKVMMNLSANHIYHRNFTHNSIKLCRLGQGEFELKIIDFELVKLYEKEEDFSQATVYKYVNEQTQLMNESNIRQYGAVEWDEHTEEWEYEREQKRRTAMILCNLLCPAHFDNSRSYKVPASWEEIWEQKELKALCPPQEQILKQLFGISDRLMNDSDFGLSQAYGQIESVKNEYKG